MDGQELYNLYEAYMEVYMDEGYKKLPADKMAKKALKKNLDAIKTSVKTRFTTAPQSTARNVDVAKANKKLSQAKKIMNVRDKTHVPAEAKTKEAKNRKTDYLSLVRDKYSEQVDFYDIILSHLLDEGYAETPEAAENIMVNMSDEWRDSIMEEVLDEERKSLPITKMKEKEDQLKNELQKRGRGRSKIGIRLDTIQNIRRNISKRGGKEDLSAVFNP